MRDGKIRLALPSKGELEHPTLTFLAECGMKVGRNHPRQYQGWIESLPGLEIVFQRVSDIPSLVQSGHVTLGITGYDIVAEHRGSTDEEKEHDPSNADLLVLSRNLGYGECRLVIAVPETWNDVHSCADLWHLSNSYSQHQGRNLRIATKYPALAEQFLHRHDIYGDVFSPQGALEAAPFTNTADLIVDLTASGTTLRQNHLKVLDDGEILLAQACLLANGRQLKSNHQALQIAIVMLELMDAHAQAHAQSILMATLPLCTCEDFPLFRERLGGHLLGMHLSPSQVSDDPPTSSGSTLSAVVGRTSRELLETIAILRSLGASSITMTPLTSRFMQESVSVRALHEQLERMCYE